MAIDTFLVFFPNTGAPLVSESQIDLGSDVKNADPFSGGTSLTNKNFFEIDDYAFDVEQTLNLGSQSSGAGAGKIQFNPLSITRRVDLISNKLFLMAAQGTPFKNVDLLLRKANGETRGATFMAVRFGLVAVKTYALSHDDESPRETVTFEYGSVQISYAVQDAKGTYGTPTTTGWDRTRNVAVNG